MPRRSGGAGAWTTYSDEVATDTAEQPTSRRIAVALVVLLILGGIALHGHTRTSTSATAVTVSTVRPTKGTAAHHHPLVAAGVFSTPFRHQYVSRCPMRLTTSALRPIHRRLCTVLSIGDSLGIELGWGLATEFARTPWVHLIQVGKVSTGLTNAWFYDWPAHLSSYLAQYHPNVVIAFMGANDEQNFFVNNQLDLFGSVRWRAIYAQQVRRMAAAAARYHATLVWVGLPVMQNTPYGHGIRAINALVASTLRHVSGSAFIPTEATIAGPSGQFLPSAFVNGAPVSLRSDDGIHMSYAAEQVVATFVTQQLNAVLHVHVAPAAPASITKY